MKCERRTGMRALALLFVSSPAFAAADSGAFSGAVLGLIWVVPFAGMLLSIALLPLLPPGAAMLVTGPLIRANDNRRHKAHVVIFFIFLVGNIGGSLTPLGDPPLFLGFLKGVDFFWTARAMFLPMMAMAVILLALFYAVDYYFYHHGREERP